MLFGYLISMLSICEFICNFDLILLDIELSYGVLERLLAEWFDEVVVAAEGLVLHAGLFVLSAGEHDVLDLHLPVGVEGLDLSDGLPAELVVEHVVDQQHQPRRSHVALPVVVHLAQQRDQVEDVFALVQHDVPLRKQTPVHFQYVFFVVQVYLDRVVGNIGLLVQCARLFLIDVLFYIIYYLILRCVICY